MYTLKENNRISNLTLGAAAAGRGYSARGGLGKKKRAEALNGEPLNESLQSRMLVQDVRDVLSTRGD